MKKILLILTAMLMLVPSLKAQSIWTSVEIGGKIIDGFSMYGDLKYRTHDKVASSARFSAGLNLDYKICPYAKTGAGYVFLEEQTQDKVTGKGNIIPAYWYSRHRAFYYITGIYSWRGLEFSLRERYQYTFRDELAVPKFASDGTTPKNDEIVPVDHKHTLRSRLGIEYKFKKPGIKPYFTAELYNDLAHKFMIDKARYTVGTEYKINKKNSIELYYRYVDDTDIDDPDTHVIGFGYKLKL